MLARSRRRDIRRRVLRLHRSSIPTGPAHLFSLLIHFLAAQIVIAPREADETSLAYFAITPVTYLGFGGVQEDNRRFNSESEISTRNSRLLKSKTTKSRSRTAAMGPPHIASGATWPAISPWVAPEKRPSVSSATESPSPAPTNAPVMASISG